jgi:hypothetical protein
MAEADHHRPGELPEIRDEAADTPMWVPALGLALLMVAAVFIVWQSASERLAAEEAAQPAVVEQGPADAEDAEGGEVGVDAPTELE